MGQNHGEMKSFVVVGSLYLLVAVFLNKELEVVAARPMQARSGAGYDTGLSGHFKEEKPSKYRVSPIIGPESRRHVSHISSNDDFWNRPVPGYRYPQSQVRSENKISS